MKKLYRSTKDKKLTGLCGGLAEVFRVDPTILRLVVVVTTFFSGGTVILLYIVAAAVVPKDTSVYPYPVNDESVNPYQSFSNTHQTFHEPYHSAHFRSKDSSRQETQGLDDMMDEIEKKALRKEIEELKKKLKQYEQSKGEH